MNQPYIYIHIYSLHLDAEKNVENKYMDTKGEVGQEVGDWDWYAIDTMCKKITNENILYSRGNSV